MGKIIAKYTLILTFMLLPLLAACGEQSTEKTSDEDKLPIVLKNQFGEEVTVPINNKPTVFFFFTTYT